MDKVVNDDSRPKQRLESILAALDKGVILLDSDRQIAWIDERTRARLNGGIDQLAATLRVVDTSAGAHCCLCIHEVTINGKATAVCLVQESELSKDEQGYDMIAAVEAAMADASWFTRAIVEKLKAFRQIKQPMPRTVDLDLLSDREREVLALICDGRSDAQMGTLLGLSQNTVRNHIASLYRKIGVNRRSAAIIWARERGITSHDALPQRRRPQPRSESQEA
jgi:DNA-binding CsgD family transcriptional regulator